MSQSTNADHTAKAPIKVNYQNRLKQYAPIPSALSRANSDKTGSDNKDKAKKRKTRNVRNVGKLHRLMQMPLDIFYEIASHLLPLDLLQLSRISHYFRSLLTSRNSRFFWLAARRNIDIPDCPPDLSEMQYASLVFERNCFACGVNRSVHVSYSLKVRFCAACWKVNVKKSRHLLSGKNGHLNGYILNLLIAVGDYRPFYHEETIDGEIKSFHDNSRFRRGSYGSFYKPEFDAVAAEYFQARKNKLALSSFVAERKQIISDTIYYIVPLRQWEDRFIAQTEAETQKKEDRRRVFRNEKESYILEKLLALGYTEADLPPRHNSQWIELLTCRGELTDKYWDRILFPKLDAMIQKFQAKREAQDLCERLTTRTTEFMNIYKTLPLDPSYVRMTLPDLLQLPFVLYFLGKENANLQVTQERVYTIFDQLSLAINNFTMLVQQDLFKKMSSASGESLECISAIFQCVYCPDRPLLSYPNLSAHLGIYHPSKSWEFSSHLINYHATASIIAVEVAKVIGIRQYELFSNIRESEKTAKIVCLCGNSDRSTIASRPMNFLNFIDHILKKNELLEMTNNAALLFSDIHFVNDTDLSRSNPCIAFLFNEEPNTSTQPRSLQIVPFVFDSTLNDAVNHDVAKNFTTYMCQHCPSNIIVSQDAIQYTNDARVSIRHSKQVANVDVLSVLCEVHCTWTGEIVESLHSFDMFQGDMDKEGHGLNYDLDESSYMFY